MQAIINSLFEDPWPIVIGLIAVAVVLRLIGRQRQQARLVHGSRVALGLAIVVWLVAYMVTTDRERVIDLTKTMLAATTPPARATLEPIFDSQVTLQSDTGSSTWLTGESTLLNALVQAHQRVVFQSHSITAIGAQVPGDVDANGNALPDDAAMVVVKLKTTTRQIGAPIPSAWRIYLQKYNGQWQVTQLRCLDIRGMAPGPGFWNGG